MVPAEWLDKDSKKSLVSNKKNEKKESNNNEANIMFYIEESCGLIYICLPLCELCMTILVKEKKNEFHLYAVFNSP